MSFLQIAGALLIVVLIIARQVRGEPLRGRRLIVLPVALTVIGAYLLAKHDENPTTIDWVFIGIGAFVAVVIGLSQGASTVLEPRGGALWARTPVSGLWLWLVLIVSRIAITAFAVAAHAHVAGSASPILFTLGLNRLGQAIIVAPRALKSGVPMAAERDGQPFIGRMSDALGDDTRRDTGGSFTPARDNRYAQAADARMQAAQLRRERRRERRSYRRGGY